MRPKRLRRLVVLERRLIRLYLVHERAHVCFPRRVGIDEVFGAVDEAVGAAGGFLGEDVPFVVYLSRNREGLELLVGWRTGRLELGRTKEPVNIFCNLQDTEWCL